MEFRNFSKSCNFVVLALILFLVVFPSLCSANPISIPAWTPEKTNITFALVVDVIVDLLVVTVTLALMSELRDIEGLTFVSFMFLVVSGGLVIDGLALLVANVFAFAFAMADFMSDSFGLIFAGFSFGLLYYYNSSISEIFLDLPRCKCVVLALAVAIVTNPVYYYLITS